MGRKGRRGRNRRASGAFDRSSAHASTEVSASESAVAVDPAEGPTPSESAGLAPRTDNAYHPAVSGDAPRKQAREMPSFGESLRRERELRRISLREVSEATKINVRYLEALEANEFANLPGGAFTKGYIRAYSRFIGTDETETIHAYLFELKQQGLTEDGSATDGDPFREGFSDASSPEALRRKRLRRIVLIAVIILLLALLGGGGYLIKTFVFDSDERSSFGRSAPPEQIGRLGP